MCFDYMYIKSLCVRALSIAVTVIDVNFSSARSTPAFVSCLNLFSLVVNLVFHKSLNALLMQHATSGPILGFDNLLHSMSCLR